MHKNAEAFDVVRTVTDQPGGSPCGTLPSCSAERQGTCSKAGRSRRPSQPSSAASSVIVPVRIADAQAQSTSVSDPIVQLTATALDRNLPLDAAINPSAPIVHSFRTH